MFQFNFYWWRVFVKFWNLKISKLNIWTKFHYIWNSTIHMWSTHLFFFFFYGDRTSSYKSLNLQGIFFYIHLISLSSINLFKVFLNVCNSLFFQALAQMTYTLHLSLCFHSFWKTNYIYIYIYSVFNNKSHIKSART